MRGRRIFLLWKDRFLPGTVLLFLTGMISALRLTVLAITDPKRRRFTRDQIVGSVRWSGMEQVLDQVAEMAWRWLFVGNRPCLLHISASPLYFLVHASACS